MLKLCLSSLVLGVHMADAFLCERVLISCWHQKDKLDRKVTCDISDFNVCVDVAESYQLHNSPSINSLSR